MKLRLIPAIVAILFAAVLTAAGCSGGEKVELVSKEEAPAAKATQQISTPTLKKPEPRKEAAEKKEVAKEAEKPAAVASAAKEEPEEQRPGMALKTPPIPKDVGKRTGEEALQPEEAAKADTEAPKATAAPMPTPEAVEEITTEKIAATPTLIADATAIDIVLDASGSMSAPYAMTGRSKYDIVRGALEDILLSASEQRDVPRNIGIRLFGAGSPFADQDCKDTKSVVDVGPLDFNAITKALAPVMPQGTSPLSLSLSDAQNDFPKEAKGDRMIVLIADGSDTCKRNPCAIAERLRDEKIIVQVIGFDISEEDKKSLECLAKDTGGALQLARNEAELRKALDDAINANVPYNLRILTVAKGTPVAATITVLEAGTSKPVQKDVSFGSKIMKLPAGTYDVLVEFHKSPEKIMPSKKLTGVEILADTKVEHTVNFDIGTLSLGAIDESGEFVPARMKIMKSGSPAAIAEIETGTSTQSFPLTAGTYDISAQLISPDADRLLLAAKSVKVEAGTSTEHMFRFQKGKLNLRGVTTQKKPMPFIYQVFAAGRTEALTASGAIPTGGRSITLSPGRYDLIATGQDPDLPVDPRTKVSNITITAATPTDLTVIFEMGSLTLKAIDDADKMIPAEFTIQDKDTKVIVAKVVSDGKKETATPIPPGAYNVIAHSLRSNADPLPTVTIKDVQVNAKEPTSKVAKFVLGTIRMRGTNTKEDPVRTQFTVYESGTDEVVSSSKPTTDWVIFELPAGMYDVKAVDMTATSEEKPHVKISDLKVSVGQTISHQAIFTAGKIKIIGRGPNNKIISVAFKIFEYGADRELINGTTTDDWATYEIPPGRYYLEAGYVDPDQDVLLKKWVNLLIGKNEVVEQVLRF